MILIIVVLNLYKINVKIDKTRKVLRLLRGGREDVQYNFREKRKR